MPVLATSLPLRISLAPLQRSRHLPALALLLCVPLLWQGGMLAMLGAAIVAWSGWHRRRTDADANADDANREVRAADTQARSTSERGHSHMVSQLIPVWSRQMNATRQHTSEGVQNLLDAFNAICTDLSALADGSTGGAPQGASDVNSLMAAAHPAVDLLAAAASKGLDAARATQGRLLTCAELARRHRLLSNRLRAIARHTRLVAFNAAIEARRGDGLAHAGFITLAEEVKLVSSQMEDAASSGDALSDALEAATAQARTQATLADGLHHGLEQEIAARARDAIALLLQTMGKQDGLTGGWRAQADHLRAQIDDIYVQFQFGDRVSQMIDLISTNMSSFTQWMSAHPHPTQADAHQWLQSLESQYSMEEQRAYHHGNVHVDTAKGIEFF